MRSTLHPCYYRRFRRPTAVAYIVFCFVFARGACCSNVLFKVVTSKCTEDIAWLRAAFPDDLTVCAKRECLVQNGDGLPIDETCSIEKNAGLETAAYLNYIKSRLESQDSLPFEVAFVHGHETAWHHRYKGPLVDAIRRTNATRAGGYVSLNARFLGPLPPAHLREIEGMWTRIIAPYMGPWPCAGGLYPPCCAQFRVTRERILAVPRAAWARWLDYSLEGPVQAKQFEFVWHVLFGQPCVMGVTDEDEYLRNNFW